MDSFTENILERARVRQKKLEELKEPEKSTPLRDNNAKSGSIVKSASASQPNLSEKKSIPQKDVASDSNLYCKKTTFDPSFKENLSEGNLSPFKRNSSTRISSHMPASPKQQVKHLNINRDDFNMEIKLMSADHLTVEVEIQEADLSDEGSGKPNGDSEDDRPAIREQVKNRLQKLGRLYAGGEDADISSPITRTEAKFLSEDVDSESNQDNTDSSASSKNSRKGLNKLADLAQNISKWEDDTTKREVSSVKNTATPKKSWKPPAPQPPSINSTRRKSPGKSAKKSPAPKPPVDVNVPRNQVKEILAKIDSNISEINKDLSAADTKPLKWDQKVLDKLESQGFTRTTSNSKLVYNYAASQENKPPAKQKQETIAEGDEEEIKESKVSIKLSSTKSKVEEPCKSPVKARSAAIANRAAMFETPSSSPSKNTKDPALLSVSERKAMFEKNKGAALVPKAPFAMATPVLSKKTIGAPNNTAEAGINSSKPKPSVPKPPSVETTSNSPVKRMIAESSGIASKMAALLNKKSTISEKEIENNIKEQRQKEMDLLLNRFNRHKEADDKNEEIEEYESDGEDATETTAMISQKAPQIVTKVEVVATQEKTPDKRKSGEKRSKKGDSPQVIAVLEEVKRIKVTQPKDGKLYPCLSDIEATTETEQEQETASGNSSLEESFCDSDEGNTSFGREILQAVCRNQSPQKRSFPNETESDVSDILGEMDDYLDEALAYESDSTPGPTPPKHGKLMSPKKKGPQPSESFYYKPYSQSSKDSSETDFKSPKKVVSPRKSMDLPTYIVDGDDVLPLTHTVSFYRKQTQTQTPKTPVRQISRTCQPLIEEPTTESISQENEAVQKKIKLLNDEVNKQLNFISQTSQALNLCNSTPEFSGSQEQVEAEKVLLIATHRRQAALHEKQRLEVEGTLRPQSSNSHLPVEKGSLTITDITLPLKREYVRALAAAGGKGHHVLCLVKCGEQVTATQLTSTVASACKNPDLDLVIPGYVRLADIYMDSAVTFEVYCLQAQQEIFTHEVKYHINKKGSNKLTPKKGKAESRMTRPPKESPAGPNAVRSPSFALMGYVVFSIQAKNRTHWTLNKTPSMSPLEGSVEMKINCEISLKVEHRGFLTMFEDVSGFGAWHRRWCCLKGHMLSYWKYPDEEGKKAPIDSINLKNCITKQVGPVSRDICARLNTLLVERERPAEPRDKDSLTTICNGDKTIIRHLLSADTKDERLEWCHQINKSLSVIRVSSNE